MIKEYDLYSPGCDTPSTRRLCEIVRRAHTPFILLNLTRRHISISETAISRISDVAADTGASMIYTDFIRVGGNGAEAVTLADWQPGAVRETFDFGDAVVINVERMKAALAKAPSREFAGFYDLWLRLSRTEGGIFHLPEPVYTSIPSGRGCQEQSQFAYLDPANRAAQEEYEAVFTDHLKALGAWLSEREEKIEVNEDDYKVVASVVIPVKNRVTTIADAIKSALSQTTDFSFNVIVVDNHSSDGTSDVVRELSIADKRVVRIEVKRHDLGIGGCWNLALAHRLCGAYAVQLDSDDLYASPTALQTMVDALRSSHAAMAVGSYRLTDFDHNEIAPGVIDHREWTAANGHNNLLRVNGVGAPRAYATEAARICPFPNVSYGEDYAMALRLSRDYAIERVWDVVYECRRWEGNSDAGCNPERDRCHNAYKDTLRSIELKARRRMGARHKVESDRKPEK